MSISGRETRRRSSSNSR